MSLSFPLPCIANKRRVTTSLSFTLPFTLLSNKTYYNRILTCFLALFFFSLSMNFGSHINLPIWTSFESLLLLNKPNMSFCWDPSPKCCVAFFFYLVTISSYCISCYTRKAYMCIIVSYGFFYWSSSGGGFWRNGINTSNEPWWSCMKSFFYDCSFQQHIYRRSYSILGCSLILCFLLIETELPLFYFDNF